jgi:CRP/FNR family cyclic AMP-dependent transcriptional regulator
VNAAAMARRPSVANARLQAMLASSAHFGELPGESRQALASIAKTARFKDAELVQSSNPASSRLWLVVSGALRISIGDADRSATVAVIGPGSFYNAGALVGSRETFTESHAVGETELGVVDGEALLDAARRDATLHRHLKTLLVRRLNSLVLLFWDGAGATLATRLARRLMSQALAAGDRQQAELEVRLSQAMLAEMLSASRSKVNAELRILEQARIVRLGYRRIAITDLGRLCDIAGPNVQPF